MNLALALKLAIATHSEVEKLSLQSQSPAPEIFSSGIVYTSKSNSSHSLPRLPDPSLVPIFFFNPVIFRDNYRSIVVHYPSLCHETNTGHPVLLHKLTIDIRFPRSLL